MEIAGPAFGFNGAPPAFYGTLRGFVFRVAGGLAVSGRYARPMSLFRFRTHGGGVGVLTTHTDDLSALRGEGCVAFGAKALGSAFWEREVQREKFVHVGMELALSTDISAR